MGEGEEVRGDDPVEYFLFAVVGSMAVEVPQNEEISGIGKNGGRKGVGSAISRRRVTREGVHIKK